MAIGYDLKKKLSKRYEPSTMVTQKFRGNDISFKTDDKGDPVLLFIGKMQSGSGTIKGERYVRTLIRDAGGKVVKDHWDLKGKTSG